MSTSRPSLRSRTVAFGASIDFGQQVARAAVTRRVVPYLGESLRQAAELARGSTNVVLAMTFAFGLVVGIEGSYGARLVGAPAAAGGFTAIGDLREITPYAFAYIMAAKVSAGCVAKIGTMRISDEVDALDVMGVDSLSYLCATRMLGAWIVMPFLYTASVAMSFIGSFIAVVLQIGQTSAGGYLELFWKFQSTGDFIASGAKAMIMATYVVLVGCYFGYTARDGPVGVGRATARATVVNLIGIHVIGILGSQIFWGGTPRLPIGG